MQTKSKRKEFIQISVIAIILIVINYLSVLLNMDNWGVNDWDPAIAWYAIIQDSIVNYHQLPLWSPYVEGGRAFYLYPEHIFYYPLYYLVFPWLELIHAFKIFFLLHILIAYYSCYYFARSCNLNYIPALFVAILFSFNSSVSLSFAMAHIFYFGYSWIPLLLLAISNIKDNRLAIALGVFSSSMLILSSSTYVAIITFMFTFILCFLLYMKGNKRPFTILFFSLGTTFFITMFKTIPEVFFMNDLPRVIDDYSGHSISSLLYSFVGRAQNIFWEHDNFGFIKNITSIPILIERSPHWLFGISGEWPDNGSYIGIVPFLLALYGMFRWRKKYLTLIILISLFVFTSFGTRTILSPWSILKHFPLLESMRSLMRFKIIAIPFVCLFSGFALQLIIGKIKSKYVTIFSVVFVIICTLDLTLVNQKIMSNAYPFKPLSVERKLKIPSLPPLINNRSYGKYSQTAESGLYPLYLEGYSIREKVEDRTNRRVIHALAYNDPKYIAEHYLLNNRGQLNISNWTPNRIKFNYSLKGSDKIIINQNFNHEWRATKGHEVKQYKGKISIPVEGDGEVELYFFPLKLYILAGISFLVFIMFFYTLFNRRAVAIYNKLPRGHKHITNDI